MTILTRFQGNAAVIQLNRPQQYNATNLETIREISQFLLACSANNHVKKIIITSNHPKAFCAGGDIRAAHDALKNNDVSLGSLFFDEEYKLIYDLATCQKPIISLVNGLCFGGGMGLSMHNQYRIITENAVLGMPETIIGFFPDVAASFRFAQFPKPWANFYGLTGNTISNSHALKWNMADYFVRSEFLPDLLNNLCTNDSPEDTIKQFSQSAPNEYVFGTDWVCDIFSLDLSSIFKNLENHGHHEAKKTLHDLKSRSPLSLLVTHKLLEMSPFLDLKKALTLDHVIAMNFLKNPDFQEGIRAQVIDKDKNPKWKYEFSNISDDLIRCFFTPTFLDCNFAVAASQNLVN